MKLIKLYKRLLVKLKTRKTQALTEDEFYEELFIDNPSWNSKEPNNDELKRWNIIEKYIIQINNEVPNLHILDLGCGRGWLTNLLSDYGSVIGLEPVKRVVNYARKLFPELQFIVGSTPELIKNNHENTFDVVVCSEVIEHISDDGKDDFLNEIFKILKPDGYCIITTPRKEIQKQWNKYTPANQPVEDWISEVELTILLKNNKFEQRQIERIPLKVKNRDLFIEVYQVCLFKKLN